MTLYFPHYTVGVKNSDPHLDYVQLIPKSCACEHCAFWSDLCKTSMLQETLMPYILALLLPSLYAHALLLSLLLKLHEYLSKGIQAYSLLKGTSISVWNKIFCIRWGVCCFLFVESRFACWSVVDSGEIRSGKSGDFFFPLHGQFCFYKTNSCIICSQPFKFSSNSLFFKKCYCFWLW